jgi:sugar phosphate isomerase/epimerase
MTPTFLTDSVTTDLDRALHYAGMWGLDALELRTVGGPADRVPYVNERKLRRRLEEYELDVAAVSPGLFDGPASARVSVLNEIAALPDTFAFCARIGCSTVVASSFAAEEEQDLQSAADLLRRAGDAAGRKGLTLALLNEHDGAHATPDALAELLAAVDHPHVRAAYSPADAAQAGADPAQFDALAPFVALVRVRDGVGRGADWQEVVVGEGELDWADLLTRLHRSGFDGAVSLDVRREPKAKSGVRGAAHLIASIRAANRSAS